jgi:aminobenzoyl-glutamate transport protein
MRNNPLLRFLDAVERIGSKLPDPVTLFVIAAGLVVIISFIAAQLGTSVVHPGTGEAVTVVNLLSGPLIRRMFTDAVVNFTNFPPLGLVLVTMIGIAVAERGGLITAMLRKTVHSVPHSLLTGALVFAGVNSSLVADAGYVVLIPLGAVIFAAVGRHPLAGLSATFAGVAGGFSANLSVTSLDPLLGGITESAAHLISPVYTVSAAANWYFMIASTFFLTIVGTVVCEKIVEPRLGDWSPSNNDHATMQEKLSTMENRGLLFATIAFVLGIVGLLFMSVPEGAILRDEHGSLKPLEKSIVLVLMLLFLVSGIVYAAFTRSIKNDKDVAALASDGMATMGGYIVLSFVMAQFISYFAWSNLGVVTAVNGANILSALNLQGPVLLTAFILVTALINLLIASASAKWAIMAPVFVPMFMLLGISPEATQMAYRVGDSSTNMIAPLLSYIPLILVAMRRYKSNSSLGTLMALMLPYSFAIIVCWSLFMLAWLYLGIPIGPGSPTFVTP